MCIISLLLVVPVLVHILANEGLTPHEINMIATEMYMGGVDTVSCNTRITQNISVPSAYRSFSPLSTEF